MNRYIILLSGGVGSRFNSKKPKQYNKNHNGDYYFVESLKCFLPHINLFHQLVVVCNKQYCKLIKDELSHFNIKIAFVDPGITRQCSVNNAIEYLRQVVNKNEKNHLFLHEAVRPFGKSSSILKMIKINENYKSVSLSLVSPVLHAIYNKDNSECTKLIQKDEIIELQLPKRYDLNFWFEKTINKPYDINAIDESQLFFDHNILTKCIHGSTTNIKITYPEHKYIGNSIWKMMNEENNGD